MAEITPEQRRERLRLIGVARKRMAESKAGGNPLARGANAVAQGFTNAVGEAVGALPDLMASGVRAIGGPAPEDPNFYANTVKSGFRAVGGAVSSLVGAAPAGGAPGAQNALERGLYGVGHGLGDTASMVVPATAVANATKAGTLTNRVAGSLAAQPGLQAASLAAGEGVGEATQNPYLGVATTFAVPVVAAIGKRVITPFPSKLTPEKARLSRVADKEGINLRPGQATGSRNLQATESVLDNLPGSGGMGATENQTQHVQFNRAVLKRAGIHDDYATPEVLDAAGTGLSKEFEDISMRTPVKLDKAFHNALGVAVNRYGRKLPSQQRAVFDAYVKDVLNVGTTMPGPTYQVTRSDLGKQAKAAATNDPYFGQALKGVKDALDDAMVRSVPADQSAAYKDLRQRYAAYKVIVTTMGGASSGAAGGDISPARLWASVKAQNPTYFPRGKGELNDLARVGQAFIKDQIPDSGTAQRAWLTSLLTGGLTGGSAVGYVTGDPMIGMATAAGAMAMPAAVKTLMSTAAGKAYLKNQLLAIGGPKMNKELAGTLILQAARRESSGANMTPDEE